MAREINPKGETVWEFTSADVPDYQFNSMQTATRLPNGNTLINSWVNQWSGKIDPETAPVQALEITARQKNRLGFCARGPIPIWVRPRPSNSSTSRPPRKTRVSEPSIEARAAAGAASSHSLRLRAPGLDFRAFVETSWTRSTPW